MTKFWVIRSGDCLKPDSVESAAEFSSLPFGKPIWIEARQPRHAAHHRLFWLLCARIAVAIGATSENVCDVLKIATGHCTIVRTKTYGDLRLPKSISFAKMDQMEFREFFDRCILVIESEWGMERRDVLAAVEDILIPTENRTV